MSLENYFSSLINKVEKSDIQNNGKDKNGFFKPTRTVILQHLYLLKDLHAKPLAKSRVKNSWDYISEMLPPEWLVLGEKEKNELKIILQ
jgi:hypothetical protein